MARSGLIFDLNAGLYAPPTSEIREGVALDWQQAFFDPDLPPLDTEPTTPAGQLIDDEVAEIEAKNAELLFLSNQFNPKVNEGVWQDALGYIYFLTRKRAEPSIVTCQISGLNGTVIPYGALVQSVSGYALICNRSVTIDSNGQAETTFRCAENGPVEFAPHSVNSIVTVIPGWDTVDNAAAGAIGRNLETRSEFEARRAASVAANAHGSAASIYGALANIAGVLDLRVLENTGPVVVTKYGVSVPGHGIVVCVYGGEDSDLAAGLYHKIDNGCDTGGNTDISYIAEKYGNALYQYKIMRPTPVNFWIKVTLGTGNAASPAAMAALKQALYEDFYGLNISSGNSRVGLASTVYASRFYCSALAVDGIKNVQSIKIALSDDTPADYFDVADINGDQEPVTSSANILVS
jgi:hypothetical protein